MAPLAISEIGILKAPTYSRLLCCKTGSVVGSAAFAKCGTIKNIASSLKTLADVPGTNLTTSPDIENLYQTVVQNQIADLQKTTLTDDQKSALAQAEDLYNQGKYTEEK